MLKLLAFFYRDPQRTPPPGDVILCPADGMVLEILEEGGWQKIAIFMNLFNVHVQRVPYDGKVLAVEKVKGPSKPGFLKAASANDQVVVELDTKIGRIIVKQIVGSLVRKIDTYFKAGDDIKAGQRYGRIAFGSRVELWLPQGKADLKIKKGQKVKAGITIAAVPK